MAFTRLICPKCTREYSRRLSRPGAKVLRRCRPQSLAKLQEEQPSEHGQRAQKTHNNHCTRELRVWILAGSGARQDGAPTRVPILLASSSPQVIRDEKDVGFLDQTSLNPIDSIVYGHHGHRILGTVIQKNISHLEWVNSALLDETSQNPSTMLKILGIVV